MVHPVSSVGRCTAAVSPSKAAANINALAWTGLWAACPCAAWTSACPALTAPSREELSCLGNAVRNGCVMSPRVALWLALPCLVSSSKFLLFILPYLRALAQVHQAKGKIVLSGCFTLCLCVLLSQPTDWKTHLAQTQL